MPPAPPSAERFRLVGPSVVLDPRIHAVRRDIADIGLADRVFAPHYSAPEVSACALPAAMLRAAPDDDAVAVSQLVQGEAFAVVDISVGWAWGYGLHDCYVGYLRAEMLGPLVAPTHVVTAPVALVFATPDIKAPVIATRTIGARLHGIAEGAFVATAGGYIHARHLAPVETPVADPVAVAETLVGAPYLWGGRGDGGVDCSGLVQRALGLAGIAAPRDSDQQRSLGREIGEGEALRRGDIILFPGHVGMMVDDTRLIHANAHWMAVTIEPLDTVTGRGAAIVARRRIA
ncbi:C40 family peptidase [Sphingomonas solaris]|uniref:NlpC/P60 family protein n=1 Tax=Alterirhizorhabdus solaris TaxID=2529389 RepID=A0A558QU99_9SPHN|nr:C40 family peptidase [Sphingomonas solaris]TVV70704.1 NlpC/P60 family protein [Sphingomonas solaris]